MTKSEVLALDLTPQQKVRVESFYQSYDRFKWETCKDKFATCTSKDDALKVIAELQKAYEDRKQTKAKSKKAEQKAKAEKLKDLIKKAEEVGYNIDSIIDIVTGLIKEAHNAKIQAEIDALKAKLI